ncbi:MAG: VOC family protein [Acidobacteria bacterium]|nr:VOC family protein [Acidobacteriota bacterium]
MSRVSTYLNFLGTTEEAFTFYREVFGTEFIEPITRIGDMPMPEGAPELSEADRNAIMNIQLPILAGHVLMGTDMLESMGHELHIGNNTTINLEPDTRAETERLYALLSRDSEQFAPLTDMPWGAYWGTCLDRFGIRWMFNCYEPAS